MFEKEFKRLNKKIVAIWVSVIFSTDAERKSLYTFAFLASSKGWLCVNGENINPHLPLNIIRDRTVPTAPVNTTNN